MPIIIIIKISSLLFNGKMFNVYRKNACINPVTGKLIRVKQKKI